MKLTAAKRAKMPKKSFAGPGKSFPISDRTHARLAIGGATRSYNAGNISKSKEESIKAAARKKLGLTATKKARLIATAHAMLRAR